MNFNNNTEIEDALEKLPDEVANALSIWRVATLEREKKEALLYMEFKGRNPEATATELKALIHKDETRYQVVLREILAESEYNRLYENLMAKKHVAKLRTAF